MQDKLLSENVNAKNAAQTERRRGGFLGLFDLPLFKDWIIWLTAIAIFAAISGSVVESYQSPVLSLTGLPTGTTEFSIKGQEAAFLIDCLFAVGFQSVLFGVLPASIRKGVRQRKAGA